MKHQMGTGNLAARHPETNNKFSGNVAPAAKQPSMIETETYAAYLDISAAAKKNNSTPGAISLIYLMQHLDDLEFYIRSKGETPVSSDNGIVAQAILLRMQDINIISIAGNLSEDEAYREIQEAESEAILNNTADKDLVLAPEEQAALNCLIVILLNKMQVATGVSDIQTSLSLIKKSMATPVNNAAGDGTDTSGIGSDFSDLLDSLGQDPGQVTASGALNPLDITMTGPVSVDTSGQSSASFDQTLNNIAATAKTVSGAISSVGKGILSAGTSLQTLGANTGASAISLYLQKNGVLLLIIILLIIVGVIILSRATRNQ